MKRKTFDRALRLVSRHQPPGRLLDVGCAFGSSLAAAVSLGWDADGVEYNASAVEAARQRFGARVVCGAFPDVELSAAPYDLVLLWDVLEHMGDPLAVLHKTHDALREQGMVVINAPCVDSLSARLLGAAWPHFKTEHLFYFSHRSIRMLLDRAGFERVETHPSTKALNPCYLAHMFERYRIPYLSPVVRSAISILPKRFQKCDFFTYTGEMVVMAKKKAASPHASAR